MKIVQFVHVKNIATKEQFDIPFDLYLHKKERCKTDPDFQEWECSEIPFPMNVKDEFKSITEHTANVYDSQQYMVDEIIEDVKEIKKVEEVKIENNDDKITFENLKVKGWINLNKEEKEVYKSLKDKFTN